MHAQQATKLEYERRDMHRGRGSDLARATKIIQKRRAQAFTDTVTSH